MSTGLVTLREKGLTDARPRGDPQCPRDRMRRVDHARIGPATPVYTPYRTDAVSVVHDGPVTVVEITGPSGATPWTACAPRTPAAFLEFERNRGPWPT